MDETNYEFGVQPLDELMRRRGLDNAALVRASTEQLSFKMVQKGRKGRKLSRNVQNKILNAIQAASEKSEAVPNKLTLKDLFNY